MFKKLKEQIKKEQKPVEPEQGKRLSHKESSNGSTVFEIKGKGYPGFSIFLGAMFLGIPSILLFAILFGTPSPDNLSWGKPFALLFLLPFFVIGISTFLIGIFLWLGKSRLTLENHRISLSRMILGKAFQTKILPRENLKLRFEKSHEEDDVAHYKLTLEAGEKKISFGGSLKEAELLWLDQQIRLALGHETYDPINIATTIQQDLEAEVQNTELNRSYRSHKLQFSQTLNGWNARTKSGILGPLGLMLFGSIFLATGLFMEGSLAEYLHNQFEWFRKLVENSTGGSPPFFFALIFIVIGSGVIIGGLWSLGYQLKIEKRHSRLRITKRCYGIGTNQTVELSNIKKFEISNHGAVKDEPRFKLLIHLMNGKKVKLLHLSNGRDTGQLKAWIEADAPQLSDKILTQTKPNH